MLKGMGLTGSGIAIPATWKVVCRDTGKENRSLGCLGHIVLGDRGCPEGGSWAGSAGTRGLTCKEMVTPCSENTGAARGRYWTWQFGVTGNWAVR